MNTKEKKKLPESKKRKDAIFHSELDLELDTMHEITVKDRGHGTERKI